MKRSFTTLTDATLITAVVQQGYGEIIADALLEVGIEGSTVHGAMGVGIREKLGALGVAVDAERDVVNVMVSSDEVDRVFERVFLAGKLDTLVWVSCTPHPLCRLPHTSRHLFYLNM